MMLLATVLVCGGCSKSLSSSDGGPDADTDSDTDTETGSDSDSASDIDTDTDTDVCTAPEGITDWGGPCHTNADCPPDTECLFLSGMDDTQGFCAAECCNYSTADATHCTDVADGQEGCYICMAPEDGLWPPFHCMIQCNTAADCPLGTDCVSIYTGLSICYGYAPVVDAGVDGGP